MKKFLCFALLGLTLSAPAKVLNIARDPYVGAIVVDADTGATLFADRADAQAYPASVLKLMDLLIVVEKIEAGQLHYTDIVRTTAEASRTGGSQVYLKEHEEFSVEDLLYALMIQSANDAAVALAIHVAGSKEGFVSLMNEKARQLGMSNTTFRSVHGLPPSQGQDPDVTTARDLSLLCLELLKHPDVLKFTSTRERTFRPQAKEPFIMRNHNHLLGSVAGCDGFKTGFFNAAGFSIAATAQRDGRRVICVLLGNPARDKRDARAAELINRGFLVLPPKPPPPPPPPPVQTAALPEPTPKPPAEHPTENPHHFWKPMIGGLVLGLALAGGAWAYLRFRSSSAKGDFVRRPD